MKILLVLGAVIAFGYAAFRGLFRAEQNQREAIHFHEAATGWLQKNPFIRHVRSSMFVPFERVMGGIAALIAAVLIYVLVKLLAGHT